MCVAGSAASSGEDDGPNDSGSLDQAAHRHYERLPQDGLRAGRRADGESRKPGEAGYEQRCPCPTPPPRTGSAEVEVEKRRGGRSDERRH